LLIHRLCVVPEKQGQGVGRRMLEFIETYAREHSHDCIRVDVHAKNSAALATYENRGFKRLGEVFFPRRDVPFVCMEKIFVSS
jgi:ribosomal protein S18 acetylase RimI-like enzyme